MKQEIKDNRQCKMCGITLPPLIRYDTNWCWMCWRNIWEAEHHRYYLRTKTKNGLTLYEEVQSLRGVFAFSKENKPLIQFEIRKERAKLNKKNEKANQRN